MRYHLLTLIGLLLFTGAYSQKIKLSKEDKAKYVKESGAVEDKDQGTLVYSILRMEFENDKEDIKISVDGGTRELPTKYSEMTFPELEKLTRTKYSSKSEVDILNYLSEEGWEIFSVESITERKMNIRKVYMRKMVKTEK